MKLPAFTPFPEIDNLLRAFLAEAQAVLGRHFFGLYLGGSLAYGDFDPRTSDLDFLVVTDGELPERTFADLKSMHARLFAGGQAWSQKLEGAYLPLACMRKHDPDHPPVPWLGVDGHFALERLGPDWVLQSWILRERGLRIVGPDLRALIDPVDPDELRQAVRASLRDWWTPPFPSPERFRSAEYRVYAVLTMCRSLYVLEHGAIASKPAARRWALQVLPQPWRDLVAAAQAWQPGQSFERREEVEGFIRLTLARWKLPEANQPGI